MNKKKKIAPKKKSTIKSKPKKKSPKLTTKDISPPVIPTNLNLLDRIKRIKDKVFSTFGLNSPND